jgi:hypothetical protein
MYSACVRLPVDGVSTKIEQRARVCVCACVCVRVMGGVVVLGSGGGGCVSGSCF